MKQFFSGLLLLQVLFLFSCQSAPEKEASFDVNSSELLHQNQHQLNQVIIYDVFTPPVASRIYAYTSLAFYEAIRHAKPGYASYTSQLNGFEPMPEPQPNSTYNFNLAATKAFFDVTHKVVFSVDSLKDYENSVINAFKNTLDKEVFDRSIAFGEAVAQVVINRASNDNYKVTRGKPKYQGSNEAGKWQPTSPDYTEGMEPYWGEIKPLLLDSAQQCMPPLPPNFSTDKNSTFYKNAVEVYNMSQNLSDTQMFIVKYWDDNPFVVEHSGHMMFANKKITPGGHWMGIAGIAAKKANVDIVETAKTYTLTSIALLEAFISCWEAKYHTDVIRPITYINQNIDSRWEPVLQTPPFPEYPSGHSAISAAASTVLTQIFGDNFSFHDDSDKAYIGMEKSYPSFYAAANEAAISRVYGGIHYITGMQGGIHQGRTVGKLIIDNLKVKSNALVQAASK